MQLLYINCIDCPVTFGNTATRFLFVITQTEVSRPWRARGPRHPLGPITTWRSGGALDALGTTNALLTLGTNGTLRSIDTWNARNGGNARQTSWPHRTSHSADVTDLAIIENKK